MSAKNLIPCIVAKNLKPIECNVFADTVAAVYGSQNSSVDEDTYLIDL